MFALALIPLILAVGAAIDVTRAYAVRLRLFTALDDAVLAVASTRDPSIDPQTRLKKYFFGNFAANGV
ncbi:MAG: TadE/TadG family type IV pilus assembly protein, partial [Roseiarcus sp.]